MHRKLTKAFRAIVPLAVAAGILFGATGCTPDNGTPAQNQEDATRQDGYDKLVQAQPAEQIQNYSPTRATKNFWIETWGDQPGKLSYVYLMNSAGDLIGYYIFEGLPVSYCTSLVPPSMVKKYADSDGEAWVLTPQPAMDGTYSSSSNCSTMYGKDASSGAYIEYTVGMGINALVYSEPLPMQNPDALKPLGWAKLPGQ